MFRIYLANVPVGTNSHQTFQTLVILLIRDVIPCSRHQRLDVLLMRSSAHKNFSIMVIKDEPTLNSSQDRTSPRRNTLHTPKKKTHTFAMIIANIRMVVWLVVFWKWFVAKNLRWLCKCSRGCHGYVTPFYMVDVVVVSPFFFQLARDSLLLMKNRTSILKPRSGT